MSEKRRAVDLGELRGVAQAAFATWTSWGEFSALQKAEILSLLQTMTTIALQREQGKKAEENTLNLKRLTAALEQGDVQ